MDAVRNPFAPGAGNPPPELAGRSDVLDKIETALLRVAQRRPVQAPIMVGLRGVGKTVLLNRAHEIARRESFLTVDVEAHENKTLPELLVHGRRKGGQLRHVTRDDWPYNRHIPRPPRPS